MLLCILAGLKVVSAQEVPGLEYYLPSQYTYDPDIPTPESVIGHQVGEWHITHDKLVQYMQALAAASDRISLEDRGSTFEGRPLLLLTVTAPENHNRIEAIREQHLALSQSGSSSLPLEDMPAVVYQGFSIHGNEPSGANAGLAYAYFLAAAQGPEMEQMLKDLVILMDPSFNPDGLQRFAYWANTNRSIHLNPENNEREYHEVSMKIARPVVNKVKQSGADHYTSDCAMAGHQIANGLDDGSEPEHPISLLRKAYGI